LDLISDSDLEQSVGRLLNELYGKRFAALDRLTLKDLINKNPYLYRAIGIDDPSQFISQLLSARISSSDETIFGNDFFEPLAFWSAENSRNTVNLSRKVSVGAGAGQDITIETDQEFLAISVKSSKNIFNSQSSKGQESEFQQLEARMRKLKKQFRKIIGYSYGRKQQPKNDKSIEYLAGQGFWELLTGESNFYLRISKSIGLHAIKHGEEYAELYRRKLNKLQKIFFAEFVDVDGAVLWEKVVEFNSGTEKPNRLMLEPPRYDADPRT
jgi:hypothetical protein